MSLLQTNVLAARIKPWVELTRVKKFAGTMVLFWPYAWALTMAAKTTAMPLPVYISYLLWGFLGASVLHRSIGGGCIWNDIQDREFDKKVERTKHRPIADGRVSVSGGLAFTAVHVLVLLRLIWNLDPLAWYLGLVSIFPLPGIYPFMKRITYWPQAWLGLAMNSGSIMAWAVASGSVPFRAVILAIGCWSWTMFYDTIYACQDKKDDVSAGVKSTALLFGANVKPILSLFGGVVISSLIASGIMNSQSASFFFISICLGGMYMANLLSKVDVDKPKDCWKMFHDNAFKFGSIVWLGVLFDYLTAKTSLP